MILLFSATLNTPRMDSKQNILFDSSRLFFPLQLLFNFFNYSSLLDFR